VKSDPRAWEAEIRAAFDVVGVGVGVGDIVNAAGILRIDRKELRRVLEDPRLADLRG
jgi:hypothetical protein